MATEKTDFLRFNAYSMKELITRKMSEDSRFTDQIYEGSNLAILIDLVAYMYQVLVFQLNNAASETMFSDTQIYENISRLVKMIGYNPRGCAPSSMKLYLSRQDDELENAVVPMYARISTGKFDRNGKQIYFSTVSQKNTAQGLGGNIITKPGTDTIINVFNGEWKIYKTVFTASGTENETFVIEDAQSNSETHSYVANEMINVVIKRGDTFHVDEWKPDYNGLFLNYTNDTSIYNVNNTNIYSPQDKVYAIRLNEDKNYEITFGNGILGEKLQKGDLVYVFYLDSNGPDGEIDVNDVDWTTAKIEHSPSMFGVDQETYWKIFNLSKGQKLITDQEIQYSLYHLQQNVTKFVPEQSVDDIRENAPNWFKTGNRLITPSDYEYFIKNIVYVRENITNMNVVDVKCMNNTKYISTFFKWLYLNGRQFHGNGRYYFNNQQFWNQFQYTMADPADANNTYLWIKSDHSDNGIEDSYDLQTVERQINENLGPVKTMTTEIKVLKPVLVSFDICANPSYDYIRQFYLESGGDFDQGIDSYIEITIDDRTMFVGNQLQNMVCDAITDYFDVQSCRMGQNVDLNQIAGKIYQIGGINNIRTIFKNPLTSQYFSVNGLCFASWSPILQTSQDGDGTGYDDLVVSTSSRKLEEFQFPVFAGKNTIHDRIRVISMTQTQVNAAQQ